MSNILRSQVSNRPLAIFDPTNKDHRVDYMMFVKTRSLGNTKNRYIPPPFGSLVDSMQQSMLEYYIKLEFGEQDG